MVFGIFGKGKQEEKDKKPTDDGSETIVQKPLTESDVTLQQEGTLPSDEEFIFEEGDLTHLKDGCDKSSGVENDLSQDSAEGVGDDNNTVVPEVTDGFKDEVTSVLVSSEIDKLQYFVNELVRAHTGANPNIQKSSSSLKFSFKTKFKSGITVEKLYLDIIREYPETVLKYSEIKIRDITLSMRELYDSFELSIGYEPEYSKKQKVIQKEDLVILKDLLEKVVFSNILEMDVQLDSSQIHTILGLSPQDNVLITDKSLKIQVEYKKPVYITEDQLLLLLRETLKSTDYMYSVKEHNHFFSMYKRNNFKVTILDQKSGGSFEFLLDNTDDNYFVFEINQSKGGFLVDYNMLKSIVSPVIRNYKALSEDDNIDKIYDNLIDMGVLVQKNEESTDLNIQDLFAKEGFIGYEDIKDKIGESIIKPWKRKQQYLELSSQMFPNVKDIIPKGVLFEGPAGTGKTTFAKIIGEYLGYPFFYIPISSIVSKRYSESEKNLAKIFDLIGKIAKEKGGSIIMIDEIDEIGANRDNSHEATGRITGVLLKKLDGIEKIENILLVASTNRKNAMDNALLNRFPEKKFFRLPNEAEIKAIIEYYLPGVQLLQESLIKLEGKSGRDIKNFSEDVARRIIDAKIENQEFDVNEYISNFF